MEKSARISECGKYRYQLSRVWDMALPSVCFMMLNPSTADAENDDNTIKRCIEFARSWGYGSLYVVNLYAYRSRHPQDLLVVSDPIGSKNLLHVITIASKCEKIICAWGNSPIVNRIQKNYPDYLPLKVIPTHKLHCLALANDGTPKHPLYLPAKLKPLKFLSFVK